MTEKVIRVKKKRRDWTMLWRVKEEKDQVGRYVAARDFVRLGYVQSVCVCVIGFLVCNPCVRVKTEAVMRFSRTVCALKLILHTHTHTYVQTHTQVTVQMSGDQI